MMWVRRKTTIEPGSAGQWKVRVTYRNRRGAERTVELERPGNGGIVQSDWEEAERIMADG